MGCGKGGGVFGRGYSSDKIVLISDFQMLAGMRKDDFRVGKISVHGLFSVQRLLGRVGSGLQLVRGLIVSGLCYLISLLQFF